ncbi:MAG: SatD family protein, partial [Pseudomonadota bacterium]
MPTPSYIAVNIDIIDSRSIDTDQRSALQHSLHALLERLQATVQHAAQPALVRGDELQFLVQRPRAALDLFWHALFDLHPYGFRAGFGVGSISTHAEDLSETSTLELDGPCYHAARRAIQAAKRSQSRLCCVYSGQRHDKLNARWLVQDFNHIARLQSALIDVDLCKPGHAKRIEAMSLFWNGMPVTDIAETLHKSKGTISTLLRRAHADVLRASAMR